MFLSNKKIGLPMTIKIIILILILLILAIDSLLIEPNMLRVKKYTLSDANLKGIKIVFVSDFHITPNGQKKFDKLIDKINNENPDIVLSTGDFVGGYKENETMPIEEIAKNLTKIKSKHGIITVLGNHDWDTDGIKITKTLEANDISVLANSSKKIDICGKEIYIAGVEDLKTKNPDIDKALIGTNQPTILLTHSPDVFPNVPQEVNLTLAGHLHGGQIRLPFWGAITVPSKYGNRYTTGKILEDNKTMIVTNGIGMSILPIRFNCPPEIVVITFE